MRTFAIALLALLLALPTLGDSTVTIRGVGAAYVLSPVAEAHIQESFLLGVSCRTYKLGEIAGRRWIRIGDRIPIADRVLRVGYIEATIVKEPRKMPWGDYMQPGESFCAFAPTEHDIPGARACGAFWLFAKKCRP
jgi:hypothetical protein